jgi:hypothetical protein
MARRRRPLPLLALLLALGPAAAAVAPAAAHDLELTRVLLLVRSDGSFQADVVCDLDALALGVSPSADSQRLYEILTALPADERLRRLEALRGLLGRRLRVTFDGQPAGFEVSFPQAGRPSPAGAEPSYLGLLARLEGAVPPAAATVSFRASRAFPPVELTVLEEGTLSGTRLPLQRGEESPVHRLGEAAGGRLDLPVAARYLVLGFWHILPRGWDHMLFVLGLFLLVPRWQPLLWQVSAFTVAHTLTLALAVTGALSLPSTIVEPLIALSIVTVAVENVLVTRLRWWRPLVVFAFGLLHGLGFAGVLAELGLPPGERLAALLAFNLGVEAGQLAVLVVAFAVLGAFRNAPWYRRRLAVPLSIGLAAVGLFWFVQRLG